MGGQPVGSPGRAPAWRRYLRFWGRDSARDLDDELQFHLAARYDDCIAAGMSPDTARAETNRRFGDMTRIREACKQIESQWERERSMTDLVHVVASDIRYAARQLRRNPSLNIAAILCLALGIGANTAIFSVVNGVLFRPLPVHEPDRLVLVGEGLPMFGDENFGVISLPEYSDYRRLEGSVFNGSAVYEPASLAIDGGGSDPERVDALRVSSNLLGVLGVAVAHGRSFSPADADTAAGPVAIISDALWHRRFGETTTAIGKRIDVEGRPTTIVGVLPASLHFPLPGIGGDPADLLVPFRFTAGMEIMRGNVYTTWLVARLADGVSLTAARHAVSNVAAGLPKAHPAFYRADWKTVAEVFPLHDRAAKDLRRALLILLAAVGLVLLTACINVSALLLARAESRAREIAVRQSLGASFGRLTQQFFVESALLVISGGALGVMAAIWVARYLAAHAPSTLLHGYVFSIDGRVLGVTAAIGIATTIIFSLLPAFGGRPRALASALNDSGRANTSGISRQRGRRALVIAQISLALVLAAAAGLMVRSFVNAREVDPGFEPQQLLTFRAGLPAARYASSTTILQFDQRMIDALRQIPGVRDVSLTNKLPLSGPGRISFSIQGATFDKFPLGANELVFPRYFDVMGIRLREGRGITGADVAGALPVAVINEALAKHYLPGRRAIGQRIKWGGPTSPFPWLTIVGVAADVKQLGVDQPADPELYFSALQQDSTTVVKFLREPAFAVRTSGNPKLLLAAVQRTARSIDEQLPIVALRPMTDVVDTSLDSRQFNTMLIAGFAGLALVLSAIGIYGVIAHSVVQRTREIGVRIAVGAMPREVMTFILVQGAWLATAGVLIGIALAVMATRLMRTLLFGVSPLDLVSFAIAALSLFVVALVAAYLPARRAARIDPQQALRAD
jgi:putative ABC transport system permease protein